MKDIDTLLKEVKRIHFIGIGGSGMCPLAEILLSLGYQLSGSDNNDTETFRRIEKEGAKVYLGQTKANLTPDIQLVIYTNAILKGNEELEWAKAHYPCFERAELLGAMSRIFSNCIGISGTHGKTTTSSMTTQVLLEAGLDPSAVIGGKLPFINGNGRVGKSADIVCEACEYVDTFLQLHPAISIITNIDADHLDYFGTLDNIVKSFHQFCLQTSKRIIVNADNANAMRAVEGITNAEIVTFGRTDKSDYYVTELNEEDTVCEDFTVMYKGERVCRVSLRVPGEHNMMNALAAAAAAHGMGVDGEHIKKALEDFSGVHRRFEILGKFEGVTVADDFAHHPTELSAVLSAAVRMGYHEVWAVFQPHTYSRTAMLLDDFAKALSIPQHVVMTEILAVRETNTYNIHTSDLAAKIPGSCWFGSFEEIADYVMTHAKENDLILTLGGGDIYKCANLIVEKYKERA